jgi:fluoroacetyl-CoA thioesterase
MKSSPKTGTIGEQQFVVESQHAIDFADGRMPAVLSTPWLIWFLEHAARDAVLPFLEPGESTVGTFLEVRHLAPTPVGATVTCRARVVQADGAVVSFQLEAHDEHEVICRGLHKLRVIDVDRFAQKVRSKKGNRS